jgi:hypothetical protein
MTGTAENVQFVDQLGHELHRGLHVEFDHCTVVTPRRGHPRLSNDWYYTPSGTHQRPSSPGASAPMRGEFTLRLPTAFNLLPALTGNGSKAVVVNARSAPG